MKHGNLFFTIALPLTDKVNFEVYKLLPFPFPISASYYSFYSPPKPFLFYSKSEKLRYTLSDDIEQSCIHVTAVFSLCHLHEYRTQPSCETDNLNGAHGDCHYAEAYLAPTIFHQLAMDSWLFIVSQPTYLTVHYANQSHSNFLLPTRGYFQLPAGSKAHTVAFNFIPSTLFKHQFAHPLSAVPPFGDIVLPNISAAIKVPAVHSLDKNILNDLHAQTKLADEIYKIERSYEAQFQHTTYYVHWFAALIIFILALIFYWRCCPDFCKNAISECFQHIFCPLCKKNKHPDLDSVCSYIHIENSNHMPLSEQPSTSVSTTIAPHASLGTHPPQLASNKKVSLRSTKKTSMSLVKVLKNP